MNRRQFATRALGYAAAATVSTAVQGAPAAGDGRRYCAFIKYVQDLEYDELAAAFAESGFRGLEVTARKGGYIAPANAAAELPKLKRALEQRGLEISILTTDIVAADQPHAEETLGVAADLGITHYRLGFYRYDLAKPVLPQLDSFRRLADDIAAMNRRLGIAGVIQNHSGAEFLGATIWDLHGLLKDHDPRELACVYDIGHATVEAGLAWPMLYRLIEPQIGALSMKDFAWRGRKRATAPLGEGVVRPEFFKMPSVREFTGPITVHVEYLERGSAAENVAALKRDLAKLTQLSAASA